jgi:phage/plasmid-associated DNA primase
MYFTAGLPSPPSVAKAREEYRSSQDALEDLLADIFEENPGGFMSRKNVRDAYLRWCEETGDYPWGADL